MPNLTTGFPKKTGNIEKDYDNLYSWAISLIDELKTILCNLDSGNVSEAGSVKAQNIDVSQAKIKDAQIKSLTADKLTAGTIDTGEITVRGGRTVKKTSADGIETSTKYEMDIQGDSIIFYEKGQIRIAIGKDQESDSYIFTVQNSDGTQGLFMKDDGNVVFTGQVTGKNAVFGTDVELGETANPQIRFMKPTGAVGATIYLNGEDLHINIPNGSVFINNREI